MKETMTVDGALLAVSDAAGDRRLRPDVAQRYRKAHNTLASHIQAQTKMLADCFRTAGADCDGNEDWRIAPRALRAVTDLRRDYDEACDEADTLRQRAEHAEAELARVREEIDRATDVTTMSMFGSQGDLIEALLDDRERLRALLSSPAVESDGGAG